jgi:hypothetical protein
MKHSPSIFPALLTTLLLGGYAGLNAAPPVRVTSARPVYRVSRARRSFRVLHGQPVFQASQVQPSYRIYQEHPGKTVKHFGSWTYTSEYNGLDWTDFLTNG